MTLILIIKVTQNVHYHLSFLRSKSSRLKCFSRCFTSELCTFFVREMSLGQNIIEVLGKKSDVCRHVLHDLIQDNGVFPSFFDLKCQESRPVRERNFLEIFQQKYKETLFDCNLICVRKKVSWTLITPKTPKRILNVFEV